MRKLMCALFVSLTFLGSVSAQSKRSLNNDGVDLYNEKKFADAEVKFKKSLEKDPQLFQGHFNLGDSYYKQGRYDEAIQSYKNSIGLTDDKEKKSKAFHNIGNALLKQQKYEDGIGAYKNALKTNPNDLETKYNLSYALNMLKQNQDKKNQQNKNDKNKDQKKDQQQQQQDKQDKKDQNKDEQKQQQQQQPKNQISKEEAQRILEAMKNNEKDMQKKLRKVKGKPYSTDKDW
ncbi:MAG: tetratricopeptide repeat protein [Ignavibacteria bacterium]|nr:tetratricopeptide repeat protein [Ignavibacteria bacterium]